MKQLTDTHVKAAELLADGVSIRSTAKQVGVSQKTIRRWRADTEFLKLLGETGLAGLTEEDKRNGAVTPLVNRVSELLECQMEEVSELDEARLAQLERLARLLGTLVDIELKDQQSLVAKKKGRTIQPITRDPASIMDGAGDDSSGE